MILSILNDVKVSILGPPAVPFYPFLREGSPTKIDYRTKGTLILTSLLEDLVYFGLRKFGLRFCLVRPFTFDSCQTFTFHVRASLQLGGLHPKAAPGPRPIPRIVGRPTLFSHRSSQKPDPFPQGFLLVF